MEMMFFYFFLALGVSFLCSILEAVLLSITPAYIVILKHKRPGVGKTMADLKANIDRPLSGILALNTMAHTLGAAGVGAEAERVFGHTSVGIVSAVLTILILVFSEIIPKTLGAGYWRALAPVTARSTGVIMVVMYPFTLLALLIKKMIARKENDSAYRREELDAQVDLGYQEGIFKGQEARIFKNMIRFNRLQVKDVMTPRTVLISFPETARADEAAGNPRKLPVSRIPVHSPYDPSDITGYVLKTDLLASLAADRPERLLKEFKHPILFIPEMTVLEHVLEQFLEKHEHIAALVNEYGDLAGIVTMEDVIETLLGMEIVDETDRVEDMQALARQRWEERVRRTGILDENT